MRPLLRARLGLGAAFVAFAIIATELDFALHSIVSFHELVSSPSPRSFVLFAPFNLSEHLVFYLPVALIALATVVGGVSLYRAIQGRSSRSWFATALVPVAAVLVIYRPPVSYVQMLHVRDALLPWAAPMIWSCGWNMALSLALQIAMYLAAAAYIVAIVLASPQRTTGRQSAALLSVNGPSALWRRRR